MPTPLLVCTMSHTAKPATRSASAPAPIAMVFSTEPTVMLPRRRSSDGLAAGATAPPPRRALRLADSATHRARLMLPSGRWSGSECFVTSMYHASHSVSLNCDFGCSVRRPTTVNGAWSSGHSTLAFSTQNGASFFCPLTVILDVSSSWIAKSKRAGSVSWFTWRSSSSRSTLWPFPSGWPALSGAGVAEYFTASSGPCRNGTLLQKRVCW